jgi:hypothetical protein
MPEVLSEPSLLLTKILRREKVVQTTRKLKLEAKSTRLKKVVLLSFVLLESKILSEMRCQELSSTVMRQVLE